MSTQTLTTRERILKACYELLVDTGGKGVRMSDIAKRAGVSRQALYLQFDSRADLFVHTTYYADDLHQSEERLATSRTARTGRARLKAYIDAWGDFVPLVAPVLKALTVMSEMDPEAKSALDKRMLDLREGCEAAVAALRRDGDLVSDLTEMVIVDLLWSLMKYDTWRSLTTARGWSNDDFKSHVYHAAVRICAKPN